MSREIEYRQFINGKMVYSGFERCGSFVMPNVNISIYPIMQYTGIKDKNGVKIYEADVVVSQTVERSPFSPDYVSGFLKGVIVYYDNSFCILSDGVYYPHWTNAEEIEVIGNIHEEKK